MLGLQSATHFPLGVWDWFILDTQAAFSVYARGRLGNGRRLLRGQRGGQMEIRKREGRASAGGPTWQCVAKSAGVGGGEGEGRGEEGTHSASRLPESTKSVWCGVGVEGGGGRARAAEQAGAERENS